MYKEKIKKFIIKNRIHIIDCIALVTLIALFIIPAKYILSLLEILTFLLKEVTKSGMSYSFKLLFIGFVFYLTIQLISLIISWVEEVTKILKDRFK